ncbi:MAG: DNA internalization-related competence protein ComEC/Rec2 [Desulfobulbaceae bacterium]|nr:MAG: DNA internalization-related competence protein ComEC/Rec2 [Desulfobulbaceae bacterium]
MINRIANRLFSPSYIIIHITLAMGMGIILATGNLPLPAPGRLTALALCLGLMGLLGRPLRLTQEARHLLAVLFFLVLGLQRGLADLSPPPDQHHIANLINNQQRQVTVLGRLEEAARYGLQTTSLTLSCRKMLLPEAAELPVLGREGGGPAFQEASGLIRLRMRGRPEEPLLPGDRLLIRAKIGPPQGFANPGSFDLRRFLAGNNIFMTGWISSPRSIINLESEESAAGRTPPHRFAPERWRAQLIHFLDNKLPKEQSVLYRALITGDRHGLPPALVERFRALGIIHLLAISGLHMALLAGGVMAVSYWLFRRSSTILRRGTAAKLAACAAIMPLIFYCLVAGLQTPALRALLMVLIFISALLVDRQWHGPTNISLAALIIIIANPLAISTASFQLSFAAVLAIILIMPRARIFFVDSRARPVRNRFFNYLIGSLLVSLAASLATLPLLLSHFNRFSLSGVAATLLVEPFLCMWALGWGLAASALLPLSEQLALLFFKVGGLGLDVSLSLVENLQPLAHSIWLATPSAWQIILFYIGLLGLILAKGIRQRILLGLCCLPIFLIRADSLPVDQATILDVGQGNCTIIRTTDNRVLVIDAGGPHTPTFDAGRQIIAPALWASGINKIDLLVLSHPDRDHYGGAAFLLEHFTPTTLWVPTRQPADPGWQRMLERAARKKTAIVIPGAGDTFPLAAGQELLCLSDLHLNPQQRQNNLSLVLRFRTAGHGLLMPGDIETDGEKQLLTRATDLASTIIIAPHHGSSTSSSIAFLEQVKPQSVIFSAGRYKKAHFPNPTIVERYRQMGATVLATPETGAITISFAANGPQITTWR